MSNELKPKQNDFIDSVNKQFDAFRCSIIETINNNVPKGLLDTTVQDIVCCEKSDVCYSDKEISAVVNTDEYTVSLKIKKKKKSAKKKIDKKDA